MEKRERERWGKRKKKMSSHMQGERNADREGGEWERGRGTKCLDYIVKRFRGESQPGLGLETSRRD